MRIIFVVYDKSDYHGGPIINARRILPELVRRGHKVMAIVCYRGDYPNGRWLAQRDVDCTYIAQGSTGNMILKILKVARSFKPEIFVSNVSVPAAYSGYWIQKSGIPTVITHRSDDQRNWCLAKNFALDDGVFKSSGLVCVSHYLNKLALKMNPCLTSTVIPSGVPVSPFKSRQREGVLKVVYSGRLEQKQKRIWDVVELFRSICTELQNIDCTIIGDGSEKKAILEYLIENNLLHRIKLKEPKYDEAYHEELAKQDVIVLLSDFEGMPGSIMDGMSCGLIPICVECNGMDELVLDGFNGFLVKNDQYVIIEKLKFLLNNQEMRKEFSDNARSWIKKSYSLNTAVDKWLMFFDHLIMKREITEKKSITLPLLKRLPNTPKCFEGTLEDVRGTGWLKNYVHAMS